MAYCGYYILWYNGLVLVREIVGLVPSSGNKKYGTTSVLLEKISCVHNYLL